MAALPTSRLLRDRRRRRRLPFLPIREPRTYRSYPSVYVEVFETETFRQILGQRLTESVVKEIELHSSAPNLGMRVA